MPHFLDSPSANRALLRMPVTIVLKRPKIQNDTRPKIGTKYIPH
jgi:hypothetical protein